MGRLGISVLSEGIDPILDIIAVHGLCGDSLRTWTHAGGVMWLRDLLPEDIPYARIMTFGYDANIKGKTLNGFRDSALLLLDHLQTCRHGQDNREQRPIMFICHSLGGIVVKQALVTATNSKSYGDIRTATIATVFIGTPHRGSQAASLGKVMINIAKILPVDISTTHLQELLPNSRELEGLSSEFRKNIEDPPIEVLNFFENSNLKIVGGSSILVVPPYSAKMDPSGTVREGLSIHGDHRQICQYPARDDSEYILVRGNLLRIIETRIPNLAIGRGRPSDLENSLVSKQNILSWLNFQMPIEEVALDGTCTWIHEKPSFQQWSNTTDPASLWIRGPPGIGKTVLASYVAGFLRAESKSLVIHGICGRNVHPLIRGVVGQLLREISTTQDIHLMISELQVKFPKIADVPTTQLLALLSILLHLIPSTTLVIDGLDEWDEQHDIETFLGFLSHECQQNTTQIKTLFISRDAESLRDLLATQSSLTIEADDTMHGVLCFTRERIQQYKHLDASTEMITEVVAEKSRGLFLWVEYFMRGLENLRNINEVYDYLENTKDGLSPTYQGIIEKLETSKSGLSELRKKILTFTAASFVPMKLLELEEAIAVRCGILNIDDHDRMLGGWDTVQTACGDLLHLKDGKVELLHLSAKEFILSPTDRIAYPSLPKNESEAHRDMAIVCLTYLCFDSLRGSLTGDPEKDNLLQVRYPMLEYATLHWADHLIKARSLSQPLLDLLQAFVTSLSGITWAVSYFPYFKLQAGESLLSAFGLLQTRITQIKVCVRRTPANDATQLQKAKILNNLDIFLVRSFENAVLLESHSMGPNSHDTLARQLDLSKAYQAVRDLERAYTTATETYRLAYSHFGELDSLTLRCKHQEVQVAMEIELNKEQQSFQDITTSFQELSIKMEGALGKYHIDTLRCCHDIGLTMTYDGKLSDGLAILKTVLTDMRDHLGRHSALTQRTSNNVANTLYKLRQLDEVEGILLSIPEVRSASRPNPPLAIEACNPYTFDALAILAMTLHLQRHYDRSVMIHERSIRGREALFGKEDVTVLMFARNQGLVFESQGNFERADGHYREWMEVARRAGLGGMVRSLQRAVEDCGERLRKYTERGVLLREAPETTVRGNMRVWVMEQLRRDSLFIFGVGILLGAVCVAQTCWSSSFFGEEKTLGSS